MATFIAYQPRGNAPPFDNHTFSKSPTVGSSTSASSRQSSKSPHQKKPVGKAGFVDFVDLTATHQGTPRECLVLRELLEPMFYDPDKIGTRVTRDRSSGATCSDKVEAGEECDKNDDGIDCEIKASDLPSLHETLTQNNNQFGGSDAIFCKVFASPAPVERTSGERGRESNTEEIASPTATTATSVRLGASQDNLIVLDDDQPVDTHHKGTVPPDDERPACEAAGPAYPGDESPKFSGGCTDSRTDDGKHTPDYSAKYNTDNCASHEQEGNESHNDDVVHTRALASGNGDNDCSGSGADSDAPASVGRIHDVFAEYEETFGLRKSKQKAAHSTLPDYTERETTGGPLPRDVLQEEPRVATDDGVTDVERAAEAAGDDVARLSKREIGSGPVFQPRQEIDGLETKTREIRSQGIHTLAGDCHSENVGGFLQPPLSPSPMTTEDASGSESGAVTQGAPHRKRSRSFTQPHVLLDEDVPQKRPRRLTKETQKAREAREAQEAVEAQRARTPLRSSHAKRACFVCPGDGVAGVDGRVAEVEDVYLGEDGSIQCVVMWKSSLIAIDSLVGGELRQQCEQLFRKRYGRKELQRRTAAMKQQIKKK